MRARNPRLALAVVVVEGLLGRLTFGMVSFALPLYALSLGLSLGETGLLVSLRTVFVLLLKPIGGWLADRIGVRSVYVAGSFVRVLAAAALLLPGGLFVLAAVRLLQGVSASLRDVASLGVIARDAKSRVATVYGWYASAKHVGGVTGAGLAGLVLAASGGSFALLFEIVAVLSILPLVAAWVGLVEVPAQATEPPAQRGRPAPAATPPAPVRPSRQAALREVVAGLGGPATVGMLVATSAYMVHGMFPILATEYAGLSEAEAGLIYSLSAVVFLLTGPTFGWLVDRHGRLLGLAWRSVANVGSSLLYLASPSLVGLALARSVDDSGKAAFRPAWASAAAELTAADPATRGRRLGALDTAQSVGEALGPALAGILWQSGGVVWLFGARILIALLAELAAVRVFGELQGHHLRPSRTLTTAAYLIPPTMAGLLGALVLAGSSGWGRLPISSLELLGAGTLMLAGLVVGALAGRMAAEAERRRCIREHGQILDDLDHDLRLPMTIIRGEVELVLSQDDVPAEERRRSSATIIDQVGELERLLERRHGCPL